MSQHSKTAFFPLEIPCTTDRTVVRPLLTRTGKREVKYVNVSHTYHESWDAVFKNKEYTFETLLESLYRNGYASGFKVFPYPSEVLSAFRIPADKVKVIIIGQDPYPGWDAKENRPVACGITFGTLSSECPGSLKRVIIALTEKFKDKPITVADKDHPFSLKGWIDQGVLLINRTPVYYHAPNIPGKEHPQPDTKPKDIWAGMTELIYRHVTTFNPNVPCVLIGKEAQELEPKLGKCYKENHPSMRSSLEFGGEFFRSIPSIEWTSM